MAKKAAAEAKIELGLIDRITRPTMRIKVRISDLSQRMGIDRISRTAFKPPRRIGGLGDTRGRADAILVIGIEARLVYDERDSGGHPTPSLGSNRNKLIGC